jgi:hypothetical protein
MYKAELQPNERMNVTGPIESLEFHTVAIHGIEVISAICYDRHICPVGKR